MKRIATLIVLLSFCYAVNAQAQAKTRKNSQQKTHLDSLPKNVQPPAISNIPSPQTIQGMPVVPLPNGEETLEISGEDSISRIKTYKMPVLKPNTRNTYIPNAADGKIFIVPPTKKKP